MIRTCISCQHWKPADGYPHYRTAELCNPVDPDTYEPMAMPFEVRPCCHPSLTRFERPVEANGFGVNDGSAYEAHFVTGPEFGCVRWEEKQR
jgi:hypothetical protein